MCVCVCVCVCARVGERGEKANTCVTVPLVSVRSLDKVEHDVEELVSGLGL